jgi:hypothetical protein
MTRHPRQRRFPPPRCPLSGFRNLPTSLRLIWFVGFFHPTGTPRVMPSEYDTGPVGTCFQAHAPSSLPASQGLHPIARSALTFRQPQRYYPHRIIHTTDSHLFRDGLPSQAWTDLEALLPTRSAPLRQQFHLQAARQLSWPSHLQGFPPSPHRVSPALSSFHAPQGVSVTTAAYSPCGARALLVFQPSGRKLTLGPPRIPRSCFPFRHSTTVTDCLDTIYETLPRVVGRSS